MQRLNKFIASSGLCSRRKADEFIENGDVVVNGRIVKELGFQVGPKDKVSVNGKLIKPLKLEYYRFYKPAGYITTSEDEKGRKTIYDLIPPELKKLKPVGRLDKDSTGLIIMTDDGEKKIAYAQVLPIELENKKSTVQVTLHQGINRQIRKMFAALGFEVISLKRVQHGTITLEGLKKGQIKPMKPKQVKELKTYLKKGLNG